MAETFDQVRGALATLFETMTGMTSDTVFERPPHSLQDFPCMLLLPFEGEFEYESFGGAEMNKVHRIRALVVGGVLSDLPEDDETLTPFIDRVPDQLQTDPDLGLAIVAQPAQARSYKFVGFDWNNVRHLALEFLVEVSVYDD